MLPIQVAKFGGTSMADADAIRRCIRIVVQSSQPQLVVVSACAGVTNKLVAISQSQAQVEQSRLCDEIAAIHEGIARHLRRPQDALTQLQSLQQQLSDVIGGTRPATRLEQGRQRDLILSFGERCSSLLMWHFWQEQDTNVGLVDARDYLLTNSQPGNATPVLSALMDNIQPVKQRLNNQSLITQGFIGADAEGYTTTLGRGGSDYSAALFAAALETEQLNIWTDVAGVYTTDPRVCPDARPLAEISFAEAAELATFGAKVLHPKSLKPAIEHDIRVFVGDSRNPDRGGTLVMSQPQQRPPVRAITCRRNQTLMTVTSLEMLHASGFLARLFDVLARHQISVDLVTTSEVSIALTLDEDGSNNNGQSLLPETLLDELREFASVSIESGLSLIAVVGNDIGQYSEGSATLLDAAAPVPIRLICQGASKHNLCFLVADSAANEIVKKLHQKL